MSKSYTGTGDDGTTARFGGNRGSKAGFIPKISGAIDEANSAVGVARSHLAEGKNALFGALNVADRARGLAWLEAVQHSLFRIGADVATPLDQDASVPRISEKDTKALEERIDAFDKLLPELKHFILPSGTPSGAGIHLARSIVRRAERELVEARDHGEKLNDALLPYVNRLSSYLFALARWVNWRAAAPEIAPLYEEES